MAGLPVGGARLDTDLRSGRADRPAVACVRCRRLVPTGSVDAAPLPQTREAPPTGVAPRNHAATVWDRERDRSGGSGEEPTSPRPRSERTSASRPVGRWWHSPAGRRRVAHPRSRSYSSVARSVCPWPGAFCAMAPAAPAGRSPVPTKATSPRFRTPGTDPDRPVPGQVADRGGPPLHRRHARLPRWRAKLRLRRPVGPRSRQAIAARASPATPKDLPPGPGSFRRWFGRGPDRDRLGAGPWGRPSHRGAQPVHRR